MTVPDYSIFLKKWADPHGGIHGYLHRFLESGDATFQHIAIWTVLQLLESEDRRVIERIKQSQDLVQMVKDIAELVVESDDEDGDDGEAEIVILAKKCLELMGMSPAKSLVEG